MRRNFLTALLVCLLPTAVAGVFVGLGFLRESKGQTGFRRGIDLAGGTILVYEVNLDKVKNLDGDQSQSRSTGLDSEQIKKLAENLKRRIDPNDLKNVVVRPVGNSRVEIILPFTGSTAGDKSGATEDFVQEVKGLVRQVGVLEFRILANLVDDEAGIREAERLLNEAATDAKLKETLDARAKAGLPPPAPAGEFTVLGQDGVSYEWVELGREEMETLLLERGKGNKAVLDDGGRPQLSRIAREIKSNPGRVYQNVFPAKENFGPGSYLLYRRDFVKQAPSQAEVKEGKSAEYFTLSRVSKYDALKVDRDAGLRAHAETGKNLNPSVNFSFSGTGASRFEKLTERNRPTPAIVRTMAVIMDEKVVSAPYLGAVLRGGGEISGPSFDMTAVNNLVRILKSGALNAELKPDPVSENTVGPTLGQDTVRRGLWAVGLSFGAVLLFMLAYYRFAGVVACVALFANLLITVGFMVAMNAAFTLPGLAGIVLMLGMAVDANVLIYERIREEREKGANLATAIRLGYDRAFGTIIDTHLTSIFTALVLYTFGNDQLKGFAVSLTLGLIISLFTALYMTRLMFDFWLSRRWISTLSMHQLFPRPKFDFMKIRYPMFALTATLTVLGLGLFGVRWESALNVDFTKGTAYGGRLVEGQERALNTTPDGKLGFLQLLGEQRQADRLKVKEVVWLTKPSADADPSAAQRPTEYIYRVVYEDGAEATVTLANPPDGATEQAQIDDVRARAGSLPGLSVEQVYLSGERDQFAEGKSRSFTVRTTERESELVQVGLDRLLRDEQSGEQLLSAVKVTGVKIVGPVAEVTLDRPASPGYLRGFLTRELRLENRVPLVGGAPAVEVAGVKSDDSAVLQEEARTERFGRIRVDVGKNPEFRGMKESADLAARYGGLVGGVAGAKPEAAADEAAFARVVDNAVRTFGARPIPDRLETFDPALAADTRNRAVFAILASWAAILVYLWFRFGSWTFGLAAVFCLVHDLCFTLGMIAVCHYLHDTTVGHLLHLQDFKIDLAAVAALLTLVGYSVNDTIVVFDRIREVRGKNPGLTPQMINDSVNQTLSRTVLASLTVFLVVGVLYWFGGEGVHLFSFVMVVGVIVGTYSSIYIASPLLLMFGEGHPKVGTRPAGALQPAGASA